MKTFMGQCSHAFVQVSLILILLRTVPLSAAVKNRTSGYPDILNGVSVPSDYPYVDITVDDNPETGLIFITTAFAEPHYSMILDNSGAPVWYHKFEENRQDLKIQRDGLVTMYGVVGHEKVYFAMDNTYTMVDTFFLPEKYEDYFADEHEFQILNYGHYLMIATKDSTIDMSQIVPGGNTKARVRGNTVLEMDADDRIVFEWSAWDHYNILDAVNQTLTAAYIDLHHLNALALDHDGQLLISCRHMNEITKVNRQTGEVIWQLGGAHDDFTWTNDEGRISHQHDIRVLPNGNYTVFDNGYFRYPEYSRALELSVDTTDWTVTKVWEYHNPDYYSPYMGSAQRLPGGNTVICYSNWEVPKFLEVRPDGSKAFELDFVNTQLHRAYRSFRFPWSGKATVPYLVAESNGSWITCILARDRFSFPS